MPDGPSFHGSPPGPSRTTISPALCAASPPAGARSGRPAGRAGRRAHSALRPAAQSPPPHTRAPHLRLIGTVIKSRTADETRAMVRRFAEGALPMVADGRLKPLIGKVLPSPRRPRPIALRDRRRVRQDCAEGCRMGHGGAPRLAPRSSMTERKAAADIAPIRGPLGRSWAGFLRFRAAAARWSPCPAPSGRRGRQAATCA